MVGLGRHAEALSACDAALKVATTVERAATRPELLRLRAGALGGLGRPSEAELAFVVARDTALALDAIQVLGGNGYTNDFPVGRLLRDAKLYEIGAGTSEIRRMLIGRELFKLSG